VAKFGLCVTAFSESAARRQGQSEKKLRERAPGTCSPSNEGGLWRLDICGTEKRGWPSPVASRHPLPQGEGEQGVGAVVKQTFRALPLPLCHETSACSLEVSALMRGSLPRPWGEGGRRPGEGQPTRIAPQNVQTPVVPPWPNWPRGDESESKELLQRVTNFFTASGGAGGCPWTSL
jgi:hypothetical protein